MPSWWGVLVPLNTSEVFGALGNQTGNYRHLRQGLGVKEDGIKEAIKVKLKFDKNGMGHDAAEEFTYHWWDHVFNKAAKNLDVANTKDGVVIAKNSEESEVSSKKGKILAAKELLYGRFVKAATLTNEGIEVKEPTSTQRGRVATSDTDSDSESEAEDIGTASKLTDEQLLKICGGRTAHKGARHGLRLSAKLRRVEEHDKAFAVHSSATAQRDSPTAPYGTASTAPNGTASTAPDGTASSIPNGTAETRKQRKQRGNIEVSVDGMGGISNEALLNGATTETGKSSSKKKKKSKKNKPVEEGVTSEQDLHQATEVTAEESTVLKKKKKRSKERKLDVEGVLVHSRDAAGEAEDIVGEESHKSLEKKQKKKKKRDKETANCDGHMTADPRLLDVDTVTVEKNMEKKTKKRKKREQDLATDTTETVEEIKDEIIAEITERKTKKDRKRKKSEAECEDLPAKKKKKKKHS